MKEKNRGLSLGIGAIIIILASLFYFFSDFFVLNSPTTIASIILFTIGILLIIATCQKCEEKSLKSIDFILKYIWFSLIPTMVDYIFFPTSPILEISNISANVLVKLVVYIIVHLVISVLVYYIENTYLDGKVKFYITPCILSLVFSSLILYLSKAYFDTYLNKEYFYILSTLIILIGTSGITWLITKLLLICNKS